MSKQIADLTPEERAEVGLLPDSDNEGELLHHLGGKGTMMVLSPERMRALATVVDLARREVSYQSAPTPDEEEAIRKIEVLLPQ